MGFACSSVLADQGKTMLVVDPRLVQDGMADAFAPILAEADAAGAGIAVAGGDTASACSGWTLIREPGENAGIGLMGSVSGKFAVDVALRRAASALRSDEAQGRLVLLAAGGPQCISVACSLSQSLADTGAGVRIDVLSVDGQAARLRCLAENTGGDYVSLDLGGMADAVKTALVPLVTGAPAQVAERMDETTPAKPEAAARDDQGGAKDGPPKAYAMSPAGVPIPPTRPKADEASDGGAVADAAVAAETPAAERRDSDELIALNWSAAEAASLYTVPVAEPMEMPSQGVKLRVVPAEGEAPLATELAYEILAVQGDGAYRLIGRSWAPEPVFALNAGDYVARVTHSGLVKEYKFAVLGDGLEEQTLSLDLGYVSLAAQASEGSAPLESDLIYTIQHADGGAALVRYDPQPLLALPAGTYTVTVRSGAAEASASVDVVAGETRPKVFELGLGYLRLSASTNRSHPVQFRVETETGAVLEALPTVASSGKAQLFRLPSGRHTAVAESADQVVRKPVVVAKGALTQITLDLQTAFSQADF